MNNEYRVMAEEARHDRESSQAPDYTPTYDQAVQNDYERLAKDQAWFIDLAGDELVDCSETLQQAVLSQDESDIQQAGIEFVKSIICALRDQAKDRVGAPWSDPLPTKRCKPGTIDVNAAFNKVFMEKRA